MFERFKNRSTADEGSSSTTVEDREDRATGDDRAAVRDDRPVEGDAPRGDRATNGDATRSERPVDEAGTRDDRPVDGDNGTTRDDRPAGRGATRDDRPVDEDGTRDDRRFGRGATRDDDRAGTAAPAAERTAAHRRGAPTLERVRARQREEYGGINWGSAFFGWLVAVGVAVLLTGILAAAGAAIGLTESTSKAADNASPETLSAAGAIALLVVLAIAYYCGGYVAGRMSRFDGARQGIGSWVVGLIITLAVAVLAVVAGSQYNVVERANLPRLPIGSETLTVGGAVASVLILIGTLLFAALGGIAGARYHHKVDRAGYPE